MDGLFIPNRFDSVLENPRFSPTPLIIAVDEDLRAVAPAPRHTSPPPTSGNFRRFWFRKP